mmetsp:Transcript_33388/g.38688  ORF Transcript_33388/g.38688 Transcript_33388/m.38688 type:complete len:732 (+) Transcript_33388:413-2608(+)
MQHQNSENHTCHSLQDSTQQHRCDARNYARSPNDNRRQKLLPQRRLKCGTNKFMFSHNATEQQKSPFQKNGNNRTYLLDKHCGEDNQKLGCHRRISSNSSSCSSTCSTKTEERYPISATMTNSGSQRPVFVPVVDVESQTASNDCLSHNIYDETDRNALFLENNNDNENDKQRIILNCRDGDHDSKKNITAKTLRLNNSPATTSTTMSSSASSASGDDFSGTIGSTDYSFGDDFELNISPSSPNQNYNHCCDDQTYYGCEDDCRNKFSSPSQNLKVHQHFVSSCNQRIAVTAKENVSIVYDSPHLPSSLKCTSQEKKRPRRMRVSMIRNIALFPSTSDIGHYSRLLGMFQKENPSRCNKNNQARTLVSSTPRIIQLFFIALVAVSVSITTFYVTKVSREGNSLNNIDNNVVPSAPVRIHAQRVVYTPKIYFVDGHAQRPIFPADQKRKISLLSQPETPVEYDPTRYYDKLSSSDPRIVDTIEFKQPYEEGDCVPHHNWQTTFHPTCNDIHSAGFGITAPPVEDGHEVEESAYLFGVKGWWRHAWKHEKKSILIPGSSEVTVLKTLRYTHNFEDNFYEHNRVDAVAMERLTHSPHIIDIYNFCGQSVVTEFANGPSLGYTADKAKRKLGQKIKIAAGIARGLSDIHSTDETPSIVHFDINPDNVISTNGMLKINDFNIAKFLKWNNNENRTCGFSPEYPNPQVRYPGKAVFFILKVFTKCIDFLVSVFLQCN